MGRSRRVLSNVSECLRNYMNGQISPSPFECIFHYFSESLTGGDKKTGTLNRQSFLLCATARCRSGCRKDRQGTNIFQVPTIGLWVSARWDKKAQKKTHKSFEIFLKIFWVPKITSDNCVYAQITQQKTEIFEISSRILRFFSFLHRCVFYCHHR